MWQILLCFHLFYFNITSGIGKYLRAQKQYAGGFHFIYKHNGERKTRENSDLSFNSMNKEMLSVIILHWNRIILFWGLESQKGLGCGSRKEYWRGVLTPFHPQKKAGPGLETGHRSWRVKGQIERNSSPRMNKRTENVKVTFSTGLCNLSFLSRLWVLPDLLAKS